MNKKQKTEIEKHIHKIAKMGLNELLNYAQKWHMAKQDLDKTVFRWVCNGLDIQLMHLKEVSNVSAMAVIGDLREGEI